MYEECLVRFCSEPFSLDNLASRFGHITNVSVQRQYAGAAGDAARRGSRGGLAQTPASWCHRLGGLHAPSVAGEVWSSAELEGELQRRGLGGAWAGRVLPALRRITAAAMQSAQERSSPRAGSFEVYGLDFVLDEVRMGKDGREATRCGRDAARREPRCLPTIAACCARRCGRG